MTDPKPMKRYRASATEWETIRAHFKGERCWCCGDPYQELHHILSRGQGGDDVTVNLAPLCRTCHRDVESRDPWARSQLRHALLPTNLGYLRSRKGECVEGWLNRNYPRSEVAA